MQFLSNLFLPTWFLAWLRMVSSLLHNKLHMNPARAAGVLAYYCDENLVRMLCFALHNKLTLGTEYVGMILGNGEVD